MVLAIYYPRINISDGDEKDLGEKCTLHIPSSPAMLLAHSASITFISSFLFPTNITKFLAISCLSQSKYSFH